MIQGPGLWKVNNVKNCPDADQYEIQTTLERRKYNRTHDSFDASICFPSAFDDTYGVSCGILIKYKKKYSIISFHIGLF